MISGRDSRTHSGHSLVLPYKPFSSNVISHISPDPSILNYLVTVVLERRSTGDADRWNGIIKRTRVNNGCHSSKGVEVQDTWARLTVTPEDIVSVDEHNHGDAHKFLILSFELEPSLQSFPLLVLPEMFAVYPSQILMLCVIMCLIGIRPIALPLQKPPRCHCCVCLVRGVRWRSCAAAGGVLMVIRGALGCCS